MSGKKCQSFLLLTNKTSIPLIQKYREIFEASRDIGDTVLLYHLDKGKPFVNAEGVKYFTFTDEVLSSLNYFPLGFTLVPGSNHFPLLKFYLSHPHYDYYWCIEDDVEYTGDWGAFFKDFYTLDSDFISSHIRRYRDEPEWHWWSALAHPYTTIPQEKRIRSFNPIYRISRNAMELIHRALLSKWCGHHEVLIATLLYESGYSIHDFGGKGEFVPEGFENKFYIANSPSDKGLLTDGTMRWRPVFEKTGDKENKLYHPVKLKDE